MGKLSKIYNVEFVNNFEDYDEPLKINFSANSPEDVKAVVSALSAFYSGDPYQCFIDGEEAVLESDWGLLMPDQIKEGAEK